MNIPITNLDWPTRIKISRPLMPFRARLSRLYSNCEAANILEVELIELVDLAAKARVWPVSKVIGQAYSGIQIVMLHLARGGYAEVIGDIAVLR